MTIQSYVMGPGTFTLGAGGAMDASCQVASCTVTASEKVKTTDPEPMLCGEDLVTPDVVSLEWKLAAKLVQDLAAAGVVTYSWTNAGTTVAFKFAPSTDAARMVTGFVRLIPITVGGDPKTRPKSDVSWVIVGTPVIGALV